MVTPPQKCRETTIRAVTPGAPPLEKDMDRRSFIRLSGLLGFGVATVGVLPSVSEAVKFNRTVYKISKTRLGMGSFVSMTLFHESRDLAEEAMERAFDEIRRLSGVLSRFENSAPVARLNSEGHLRDVPPEMAEVVASSLRYYRLSGGNFDITVQPFVDLFRRSFAEGRKSPPSETELSQAAGLVGADKLEVLDRGIFFKHPGMGITLDGIAVGYIVDRVSGLLAGLGIENHLVNAGGDIRTRGTRNDGKPWSIAIQDPEKRRHYPDVIGMIDGAVSTSGNYEVYYDREKMFHHIVDPRTGVSPPSNASVSVLAETSIEADALSTSVFVMPPENGIRFIDALPGCECLVIDRRGTQFRSKGWKSAAIGGSRSFP